MTDDRDRIEKYVALIGRMQITLEGADRVLEAYKPKDERVRREFDWARENIRRRLAEAEELFPPEVEPDEHTD